MSARLLLVDDHTLFRTGLRLIVQDHPSVGSIAEAGSVAEACALQMADADLVLLDIQLPGMSGLELLTQLKEMQPDIGVIMITAFASPDDAVAEPLYKLCERYNKPVVFHAGMSWEPGAELSRSNPLAFEHTIATHPNVRFSLTHFGWPWVRETVAMLLKYPNCYTDTSITYIDSPEEMMQRLFTVDMGPLWYERALSHQVMFASNTPRFRAFKLKRALDTVPMRDDARERLYWGNALRFLEGDE